LRIADHNFQKHRGDARGRALAAFWRSPDGRRRNFLKAFRWRPRLFAAPHAPPASKACRMRVSRIRRKPLREVSLDGRNR